MYMNDIDIAVTFSFPLFDTAGGNEALALDRKVLFFSVKPIYNDFAARDGVRIIYTCIDVYV